jgi:hypothetical protein
MDVARLAGCAVRRGLAAGVLSGAPSGIAWLAGHGDPFEATREIGRRAFGRPSLVAGGAAHLGLSCAYALPVCARGRVSPLAGAGYGAALYALNFRVLAPRLWPEVLRHDSPVQLLDHLAYGVVLAWPARRRR